MLFTQRTCVEAERKDRRIEMNNLCTTKEARQGPGSNVALT